VASGKWGSGVFNGDPELKSIIQWMATSVTNKKLELYTFGDDDLAQNMNELYLLAIKHEISVGFMYQAITKFGKLLIRHDTHNSHQFESLIDFLKSEILPNKLLLERKLEFNSSSSSDNDGERLSEIKETKKVNRSRRTRKIKQKTEIVQEDVQISTSSTMHLVPAEMPHNNELSWINSIFCRLNTIPLIISRLILKIPVIGWLFKKFYGILFYLGKFCWKPLKTSFYWGWGWLIRPGFNFCYLYYQKIKLMICPNPEQAASRARDCDRDHEKEQLGLSDSD
jgi:hypothetical protein